jgi:glycosyltransferase involved in cell wall biosynthesis
MDVSRSNLRSGNDGQTRPLRVCHLAYTFYENDNRVLRYARALVARGDAVEVVSLRRQGQSGEGDADGVRVHRIQRRSVTERSAAAYLLKTLWFCIKSTIFVSVLHLRRRFDVIHVHNVPDFLVFAATLPKIMGARVVLDIHDILPELYAGKFGCAERSLVFRALLLLERASCWFADHVIVSNDLWHTKLVKRNVKQTKFTTLLNYPDLELFKPSRQQTSTQGPFVFLYPGTLNHHQGVDLAVEAFASARDRMPGAELHIYGEGPATPELHGLAQSLGVTDRVRIRSRLPINEIAAIMADADVGVVPKRADGFGNEAFSTKILEFMACGVPVIVSRTRIDQHYFTDDLVRFFQPGNASDLADAMVDMFTNRSNLASSIEKARTFAIANSWQEREGDYLRLVDGLFGAPPITVESV